LKGYDYTRPGAYYVTICLQDKYSLLLGDVLNEMVLLSHFGEIVRKCWNQLPRHYPNVKLGEFIVMPNHVHGVIWLIDPEECAGAGDVGAGLQNSCAKDVKPARTIDDCRDCHDARDEDISDGVYNGDDSKEGDRREIKARVVRKPSGVKRYPLPEVVRGFKTFSARRINELRGTPGVSVWQRNYWEHIVRNEDELRRISEYIANNPRQWEKEKKRLNC
jgi:putative transposase